MSDIEAKGRQEQALLRQSVMLLVAISAVAVLFGIVTGSFAILFDGIYSLIDASMALLALLVSRLILRDALRRGQDRPGRVRYQFGFWHLEPMVVALNATLLMAAILYALGSALILLTEGGSEPDFGWAMLYAGCVASICLAMGLRQRRRNRALQSALLALDVKSWIMSASITAALFLAFVVGLAIEGTRYEDWQPFVDPAILALVCIVVLPLPLSDLRAAVRDIFLVAPDDLDAQVTAVAARTVANHGFLDAYTYVASVGRSRLIEIHFLTPPGWQVDSIAQLDAIRAAVAAEIDGAGPNRWLTISFTADPGWAL